MATKKEQAKANNTPLVLAVLDGWGISKEMEGNAILQANTPSYVNFLKKYPHTKLEASGRAVGLPTGQAGNSEAGHMNIGAGRIIEQDAVTISRSINNGTFFKNPALLQAAEHVKKNKSHVHLMGLLSDGSGPHADNDHLLALITFFTNQTNQKIYLHLFTDGRDSSMYSALKILNRYKSIFNTKRVQIATIMGRFWGMDRNRFWDRTRQAYEAITEGKGIEASSAAEAVNQAYNRGESDEFISPTVIMKNGKPVVKITDNDALVFFSLRSDRARQLSKVFVQNKFFKKNPKAFERNVQIKNLFFVALTDFGPDLDNTLTAYPGIQIPDTLVTVLRNYRQLYIAESEKYAHVTYFFNGGYDHAVAGETRTIVKTKKVKRYDKAPAMSTNQITRNVVKALKGRKYDIIVINFAAPDMIGHTANIKAAIKAVEVVDSALGKISKEVLAKKGTMIITADHGNVENMFNHDTKEKVTKHSSNPIPFILVNKNSKYELRPSGILADVAPTILDLLGEDKPVLMSGKSLLKK